MRGSGPVVAPPGAPVAPVVSKTRSCGSSDGSIAANVDSGRLKGGAGGLGLAGAAPRVGAGSTEYGVFCMAPTPMKYPVCGPVVNCPAAGKFGPGEPLALTMPCDSRFRIDWLGLGT